MGPTVLCHERSLFKLLLHVVPAFSAHMVSWGRRPALSHIGLRGVALRRVAVAIGLCSVRLLTDGRDPAAHPSVRAVMRCSLPHCHRAPLPGPRLRAVFPAVIGTLLNFI